MDTEMSVVPLVFHDWWDDFDRPVSRLMDQHFARGLNRDDLISRFSDLSLARPVRSIFRDRYYRPWMNVTRQQQSSGSSTIQIDSKDNFQVGEHSILIILWCTNALCVLITVPSWLYWKAIIEDLQIYLDFAKPRYELQYIEWILTSFPYWDLDRSMVGVWWFEDNDEVGIVKDFLVCLF